MEQLKTAKRRAELGLTQTKRRAELGLTQTKRRAELGLTQTKRRAELGLTQTKRRAELGLTQTNRRPQTAVQLFMGLLAFLLPFFVLFWLVPFASSLTIGNDYVMFTPSQTENLQYSLEKGSFPLFVPGLACGRSSAALTLGQLYHPLPHIARMLPGYWDGNSLQNSTFLRLLMLGIANLMIFIFLRRLGLSSTIALLIGLVTVCNFRMLDLFRYGASLENYTGYLFLCTSLGFYCLSPSRIMGPVLIIVSSYLLVCGGHPQMMYYGLIGAGIVYLTMPFVLAKIAPRFELSRERIWRYYAFSGLSIFAGILISANYILPFYMEFLSNNIRSTHTYAWSLGYGDSWGGTLNAFFNPLLSDVHGNFGSTALLVLLIFLPLLFLLRVRIPAAIVILWLAALAGFLCAMGRATPVHSLFWHYVPFANSFRTPGRATMILPFIFLLLLTWLFRQNEKPVAFGKRELPFSPVLPIAVLALGMFVFYNAHLIELVPAPAHYVPGARTPRPLWIDKVVYWSGLGTLGAAVISGLRPRRMSPLLRTALGALLLVGCCVQVTAELRYGTWIKNQSKSQTLEAMDRSIRKDVRHRVLAGYGLEEPAVAKQMNESILEPKLAQFYRRYKVVRSDIEAVRFLKTKRDAHTAVIVDGSMKDTYPQNIDDKGVDRVKLIYSSFNKFVFEVEAGGPGIFTLAFPYSQQWKVAREGVSAKVFKANGYLNGVFLPAGTHRLELKYTSPSTVAGFAISLTLTFLLLSIFVSIGVSSPWRVIIVVFALVLGIALFIKWRESFYTGENLDVNYAWNSKMLPNPDNLAYGRTTRLHRIRTMEDAYRYYGGLAVDGERSGGSFRTVDGQPAWWEVDLGKVRVFSRIDIYDSHSARHNLPLLVQVSDDGNIFETVMKLDERPRMHPWRLSFDPLRARYIRLASQKKSTLQLREVEVY